MERMDGRYMESRRLLERALKVIPLGTQTFSKSLVQYPAGISPHFIQRGKGSRVWDADGNEYIDFVNALGAITLGYCDPDVTAAVIKQLESGTLFSLPHELEIRVAEAIVEMVPCAEMVRFGKNGSDAAAGAVRLARAYTKRDRVAMCGYHGWQDWSIGTTSRNLGVPARTSSLTHTFSYNDLGSLNRVLKDHPGEFAAVIMEPANSSQPAPGFLEGVKELARKNGAVFIFDETVTGFRYSNGGAQERFEVVPDLAVFGKGVANGYPLSAVAGKAGIMSFMEDVFFSFTFGGETLSLAAAEATLQKLRREPVINTLWAQGKKVTDGVRELIGKYKLENSVRLTGNDCWSFIVFNETSPYSGLELKTLYQQEMFQRGILAIGTHNMSYAHTDDDIASLLRATDSAFAAVSWSLAEKSLHKALRAKPLQLLFSVR